MHAAAFNDQVECLQLLLSHGGDVNVVDSASKTPLMMAAENGHAGAVGKLSQHTPFDHYEISCILAHKDHHQPFQNNSPVPPSSP